MLVEENIQIQIQIQMKKKIQTQIQIQIQIETKKNASHAPLCCTAGLAPTSTSPAFRYVSTNGILSFSTLTNGRVIKENIPDVCSVGSGQLHSEDNSIHYTQKITTTNTNTIWAATNLILRTIHFTLTLIHPSLKYLLLPFS